MRESSGIAQSHPQRQESGRRVRIDRIKDQVNKHLQDWGEEPLRQHELSATLRGYEGGILQCSIEAWEGTTRGIVRGLTMAAAFTAGIVTVLVALGGVVAEESAHSLASTLTQLYVWTLLTLGCVMGIPFLEAQHLRRKAAVMRVAEHISEQRASAPTPAITTPGESSSALHW